MTKFTRMHTYRLKSPSYTKYSHKALIACHDCNKKRAAGNHLQPFYVQRSALIRKVRLLEIGHELLVLATDGQDNTSLQVECLRTVRNTLLGIVQRHVIAHQVETERSETHIETETHAAETTREERVAGADAEPTAGTDVVGSRNLLVKLAADQLRLGEQAQAHFVLEEGIFDGRIHLGVHQGKVAFRLGRINIRLAEGLGQRIAVLLHVVPVIPVGHTVESVVNIAFGYSSVLPAHKAHILQ